MKNHFPLRSKRKTLLYAILLAGMLLCTFLHALSFFKGEKVHQVVITLRAEHLSAEVCEAISKEERLLLDGRFALSIGEAMIYPTPLRFYDSRAGCEFTVPSKKYSDLEITLYASARSHPYGVALYGVRTINVGMNLSLYGEKSKLYGRCIDIRVLE